MIPVEFVLGVASGLGIGSALGVFVMQLGPVRALTNDIKQMRYNGFRPDLPMPERPKTISIPTFRED